MYVCVCVCVCVCVLVGGGVGEGVKALLQPANFILGPDTTLNTDIHKNVVRIKTPNSVNASKRKHKKSN